jgi:hypothetical protein
VSLGRAVKDTTADYSDKETHAALDIDIPKYASAVVTTKEVVDSISSLLALGRAVDAGRGSVANCCSA